jgi:hypothetical protein
MTIDGGVFFRFLIAALATWRLALLLARERGPWEVFDRLRRWGGSGVVGELLRCVKCVGLWVAVPFAFFVRGDWLELVVIWLALAGVTAVIDEWTRPPFEWRESKEDNVAGHKDNDGGDQAADDRDRRGVR